MMHSVLFGGTLRPFFSPPTTRIAPGLGLAPLLFNQGLFQVSKTLRGAVVYVQGNNTATVISLWTGGNHVYHFGLYFLAQ